MFSLFATVIDWKEKCTDCSPFPKRETEDIVQVPGLNFDWTSGGVLSRDVFIQQVFLTVPAQLEFDRSWILRAVFHCSSNCYRCHASDLTSIYLFRNFEWFDVLVEKVTCIYEMNSFHTHYICCCKRDEFQLSFKRKQIWSLKYNTKSVFQLTEELYVWFFTFQASYLR